MANCAIKEAINKDNFIQFEVRGKVKSINLKLLAAHRNTPILINGETEDEHTIDDNWSENIKLSLNNEIKSFTIYGDVIGFDCFECHLTKLDVSENKILEILKCSLNELGSLDISKNINIRHLQCDANSLFELDVTNNINLENLSCEGNHLNKLDLSKCKNLMSLFCSINHLEEIDISNNINLRLLYMSDNEVSEIDLSNNPNLIVFECINNNISTLDFSKNTKIERVDCCGNDLSMEAAEELLKSLPKKSIFDKSEIAILTIKKKNLESRKKDLYKLNKLGKIKNWKVFYAKDDLEDDEFMIFPGVVAKKA